jgi:hypothetical protein
VYQVPEDTFCRRRSADIAHAHEKYANLMPFSHCWRVDTSLPISGPGHALIPICLLLLHKIEHQLQARRTFVLKNYPIYGNSPLHFCREI